MGGGAPSIPQQSLGNELGDVLHYLPQFTGAQYNLAGQYAPQYAQQDLSLSKQNAPQYAQLGLDTTKQFGGQYGQAGFDIANKLSPQYLGLNLGNMQQAIAGSPLLSSLNTRAQSGLASGGVDPLLGTLTTQAQSELGNIHDGLATVTPQEAYQNTQGTLGAFAGRNNVFNQASAADFLNRDQYARQRAQQEQGFAGAVEGQRQAGLGQAQNFGLSTQGMNQAALQGLGGAAQAPNYAGYAQSPNLAAYGAPGASYAPMGAGMGVTSGETNSLLGFGQNLFDANQNAAATQNIAASNKSGGATGAGIGAVGSIAGGLLAAY
jgi:hypothetical protein